MLGAIALVASTAPPADGVAFTRTAAAILAAMGVVAVALAFVPPGSTEPLRVKRPSPPLDARASGRSSKPSPLGITATPARRMPVCAI